MLEGLDGKVAIVTGAGRGLGRVEALELAGQGVRIVANDYGLTLTGEHEDNPADALVEEIRAAGGEAVANRGDVANWDDALGMVRQAIDTYGDLHILVNNAGFLRDRMIFNMSEQDFDDVVRVHLKGHFCMLRHASEYWRDRSKAADGPIYARVVNTTSESSMIGAVGQPNYGPAKAGVAALTVIGANSLSRYGVNVNAIAPRARTRMTTAMGSFNVEVEPGGFDPFGPENVSPLVAFLASPASARVSGQIFIVHGRRISVLYGPFIERDFESTDGWTPDEVSEQLVPFYETRTPVEQGFIFQPGPPGSDARGLVAPPTTPRVRWPPWTSSPSSSTSPTPRSRTCATVSPAPGSRSRSPAPGGTTAPSSGTSSSSPTTGATPTTGARPKRGSTELDHFTTEIDGERIHFVHARSAEPDAFPIVMTHGWPGSFVEFEAILPMLTDPAAHGGDRERRVRTSCARRSPATRSRARRTRGVGTRAASARRSHSSWRASATTATARRAATGGR